jgi:hypothetical protein
MDEPAEAGFDETAFRVTRALPRIELFAFRFRDPLTGKWVRARYVAERHEIAARYAVWEITGPPEMRARVGGAFSPWR